MPLQEEFIKSGNWLFRWRSYFPLLLLIVLLMSLNNYTYLGGKHRIDTLWELGCLCVSLIGLCLRVITIGFISKGTSGRNTKLQKADILNTEGMYGVVRHPLYLGNFFVGLGISLFFHLWWLPVIYMLSFSVYYERIMFAEEDYLRKKFGRHYTSWAEKTPPFIPRNLRWIKPKSDFSLKMVVHREYHTILALVSSMFVIEMLGDWRITGKIVFDPVWTVLLVSSIALYMAGLVFSKKFSCVDH